ncbi:MAG: exonuclease domain-containing protein [Alphaproteobacteria bacterium]|nr:exonuclease domain-containing protein [Alphaproteobacteria bacterium]
MARVICFDIETTGFEYMRGDRIIEIGAVEVIDGKITGNNFHEYINPDGKIIPPDTYMVHKISNAFLEDKPKMSAVAPKFLEFIGDSPIIAHNGMDFDFPFVNHELGKLGLRPISREQMIDTLVIARNRVFGPKSYTLDALAKWYGISLTARADAHGALIDSEILARVYLELENTAPAPNVSEIIAKQHAAMLAHPKIGGNFPYRKFTPNPNELENHNTFMEKINK